MYDSTSNTTFSLFKLHTVLMSFLSLILNKHNTKLKIAADAYSLKIKPTDSTIPKFYSTTTNKNSL